MTLEIAAQFAKGLLLLPLYLIAALLFTLTVIALTIYLTASRFLLGEGDFCWRWLGISIRKPRAIYRTYR